MKKVLAILIAAALIVVTAFTFSMMQPKTETTIPILAYHQVNDVNTHEFAMATADFEEQMASLKEEGYTAVSLREYDRARQGKFTLPAKPIIITFDDGYRDNLTVAQPILEKYGMKGTVFVATGLVSQPNYLTPSEIAELAARGMEIGSHTNAHVALPECSDRRHELDTSRNWLTMIVKQSVLNLAYPFGAYDDATIADLKAAGYRMAVTGENGLNTLTTPAYELHRINMPRIHWGLSEFKLRLAIAEAHYRFGW